MGGTHHGGTAPASAAVRLTTYAWLSIAAALLTMGLKVIAWLMTGSVGFLSDAAESIVNLVAAVVALVVLRIAVRPPDAGHNFGHAKAEYFSAALEGILILVAAAGIVWAAVRRLLDPVDLENIGLGLVVSVLAGAVNCAVAVVLLRAGRRHRSITLVADGHHLLTDVWTSVGVIVGVALVALTGLQVLDPVVALLVGANIVLTGIRMLVRAVSGLMDHAIPPEGQAELAGVLDRFASDGEVAFHAVRTRENGTRQTVALHLAVPGDWTVSRGHEVGCLVEAAVVEVLPHAEVLLTVEPHGGPCQVAAAWEEEPTPAMP